MSERNLRKRLTGKGKASNSSRAPTPSPSSRIRPTSGAKTKSRRSSEKSKVLKRSKSEPWLWKPRGDAAASSEEDDVGVLYRPETCIDIFSTRSPANRSQRYDNETKVVINVTVEGSPGPIRTMVRLGSKVEEITKLVVNKYTEEGRTPRMDQDAASTYELHHSHFSLQGLSKSDLVADIGSRSFYLRRPSSDDKTSASSPPPLPFLPIFVNRKIKKVMPKLRQIFGCIPYAG